MKLIVVLLCLSTIAMCGWYLYNVYGVKPEEGSEPVHHELSNIATVIGGMIIAFIFMLFEIAG